MFIMVFSFLMYTGFLKYFSIYYKRSNTVSPSQQYAIIVII